MSPRRLKVGIKDVARVAGVSSGTVSLVLNQPGRVSEKRRLLVEAAIEELGYVPNHAARQLKVGSSSVIGFVLPSPRNPFYSNLANGIMAEAERRDLHVLTAATFGGIQRAQRYVDLFEQQRTRGLIVAPNTDELTLDLATNLRGSPLVLAAAADPERRLCSVKADDLAGGKLAIDHLIALGKRRIVVMGTIGRTHAKERWLGAKEAARSHPGVMLERLSVTEASIEAGQAATDALLARPAAERPDAIFTSSDLLGIGVLNALVWHSSLRVPQDVAVVGYDDLEFSSSAIIPLSTVQQHERLIGELAVGLVEDELADPDHVHQQIVLDPVLVERVSSIGRG